MRRALYASSGIHAAILLWAIFGGPLFQDSEEEFEVTGVTLLTPQEFDALFDTPVPVVAPSPSFETPAAPVPTPEAEAPTPPAVEEAPTPPTAPDATPEPEPEIEPDVSDIAPLPEAEVSDTTPTPPSPPASDQTAPPSDTPAPNEAPRIASIPTPAPAPDVDIAPEVVPAPTPSEAEVPAEVTPPTAPEETTTEIVTEAETPAASLAPVASVRPPTRPTRLTPIAAEAPPAPQDPAEEVDPLADAIAAAVAEAASQPIQAAPSGPPLTSSQRDGLRLAVQNCWNVGSLSSEALRTTVTLAVEMNEDGTPRINSIRMLDSSGGSDTAARQAYEAARRAVILCGGNGYDLPIESYDHWRLIEMTFNPEEMRLR